MVTPAAPEGAVQMPNSCISGARPVAASSAVSAQAKGTSSGSRKPFATVAVERVGVHAVFVDDAGEVVDTHVRIGHQ